MMNENPKDSDSRFQTYRSFVQYCGFASVLKFRDDPSLLFSSNFRKTEPSKKDALCISIPFELKLMYLFITNVLNE